ncbi:MAG: hypothetical protein JO061_06380 [Acidobacteriaceae bacterium]|nr:hypothetical protein [Acidobacteriaceae bacterium]
MSCRVRAVMPYVSFAVISAIFLLAFVRVVTGTVDEGTFLHGAERVLRGELPGRDFVEPAGPGSFVWLALWFRLFGVSFLTARSVLLATGVAIGLLSLHLSRRLGARGYFAAAFIVITGIPWLTLNSPHYDATVLMLATLALLSHSEKKPALFMAGALAAITACCLQSDGAYVGIGLVVFAIVRYRHRACLPVASVCAGFACVMGSVALIYWRAHALPDVWANLKWVLTSYGSVNRVPYGDPLWSFVRTRYTLFHPTHSMAVAGILTAACAGTYASVAALPLALAAAAWCWARDLFTPRLLPFWCVGIAMFLAEFHRADLTHIRTGGIILITVLLSVCERRASAPSKRILFLLSLALLIHAGIAICWALGATVPLQTRAGLMFAHNTLPGLNLVEQYVRPEERMFVYPYQPIYYFAARVRNPTRYSILMYRYNTRAQFQEVIAELDKQQVPYVLLDTGFNGEGFKTVFPAYTAPKPDELIIEPYLATHYREIAADGSVKLLRKIN